ncbi:hypothetical protein E2C01_032082 [Portunus trituberculatus]|uniref:Uncharacterized protein n=1 Tax=Portunus trituberculatus TaxID=210409 RepID=A0A5B7F0E3_PORTR|nr:hypothetical protein [Portunus trituberculatus]
MGGRPGWRRVRAAVTAAAAATAGTRSGGDHAPPAKHSVGPTLSLGRRHHGRPCCYNHAEIQSALPTHPRGE